MVGAGFSKNAASHDSSSGFPDWSQLGDRFYKRLYTDSPRPDKKYLQVPALAHQVEAAFGRPALDQMLRDAIPNLQHEPSPLHEDLLELPWSDVFTTNYDTLLERAGRSVISQRYDVVLKPDDLSHSNRPRIVKLHGSLPAFHPFIITDEDYRRYPQDFAPFVNAVRQSLLENTLCLLGFSGDDPNFLQWVGWIHDNLGHEKSPKMYLVGLLDLSPSQKTLLERRNIIPVDMSLCPRVGTDHYQALKQFISYLQLRRAANNRLDWPRTAATEPASDDTNEADNIGKTVELWKTQRRQYPGWVVPPEGVRSSLWLHTNQWVRKPPKEDALPGLLDLEFAFELIWRMTKCLCPIFDNQIPFLEATVDRYWPATDSGTPPASLSLDQKDPRRRKLTLDAITHRCHYLLLAMMRYYREEGLSAKWEDARNRIHDALSTLSPEHRSQFHYEQALFALFNLNLPQLKNHLADWPSNETLPFWEAKKAGLLAEIGQVAEGTRILERSLDTIREKLNLAPTKADYTLVSQESFVMYLLHAVRQGAGFTTRDQSDAQTQRREFRERWHVLKQYKCDPWQEIETFKHELRRPPAPTSDITERPTFDIGRSIQTHHLGNWNTEALAAYNFLRFFEDAGLPFRVPGCTIATKSATGTLKRLADYSSYWAFATLVRTGDNTAIDEIFDRPSLARMSTASVDGLVERYLESLSSVVPDIAAGDHWRSPNFGTLLADILPEILSRLCCKCSQAARVRLLEWLLELYRSDRRSNYRGIRHLLPRLLDASPAVERIAMLPKLLQFPILADLNAIEELEYLNPFEVLELPEEPQLGNVAISDTSLDGFFEAACASEPRVRKSAVSTLGTLQEIGLLEPETSQRFAEVLWSQVDECGLPSDTNYYKFAFLSLPHPAEVDPAECFTKYVRGARFPAQESQTQATIRFDGGRGVSLCRDIRAATDMRWSDEDVRSIVSRLVRWWDADKAHWRRNRIEAPFRSLADGLGRRLADLLMTLATMVVRYRDSVRDKGTRNALARLTKECAEYGVPALRLELAFSYVSVGSRDSVLLRINKELASHDTYAVIDALDAIDLISRHITSETERSELLQLLRSAGQAIRWRYKNALWATTGVVGDLVNRHPWVFVDDLESDALMGLDYLLTETAITTANQDRIHRDNGIDDLSTKLVLRRAAARLAYRLFVHYQARGEVVPVTIQAWEGVCRSDDEFMEIRNEWLAPTSSA